MKKILMTIIAVTALFVSCNLDSSQGIYDSIQDARPQDSNAIADLVGRYEAEGSMHYVFNTTKGIALDRHTNVILPKYLAKAVDQKGNILILNEEGFAIRTVDGKIEQNPTDIKGKVYKSANFYENAYDFIIDDNGTFKLYYTDDLESLIGDDRTEWKSFTLHEVDSAKRYPTLAGHRAWTLVAKKGSDPLTDEEKKVWLADGSSYSYAIKDVSGMPKHLMTVGTDNYYTLSGKLFRNTEEIRTAGEKPVSLDMPSFSFTLDGNTVTGASVLSDGSVKLFQYTAGNPDFAFKDTDVSKKEILGIRKNADGSFNLILTEELGKKVTF